MGIEAEGHVPTTAELQTELTRARGLAQLCEQAGELDGAAAHRSTERAIVAALSGVGLQG